MNEQELELLRKALGISDITKFVESVEAQRMRDEQKAAEEAAEKRVKDLIASATGEQAKKLQEAADLIATLKSEQETTNEKFTKTLAEKADELETLRKEMQQVMNAARGTTPTHAIRGGFQDSQEKTMEECVMLGYITGKGLENTDYFKAVNSSSSAQVSSESYETVFSQRIMQDIQKELVVATLFETLPMTSRYLTMMIEPDYGMAGWVANSTFGTEAQAGNEQTVALTEIRFETFQMSAKAFLTDQTEEDSLVALLPIIRRRMVQSAARAIEQAFMLGTGTNQPKGLVKIAEAKAETKLVTKAKADGSVGVTALELLGLRAKLGRWGLNKSNLRYVISMEAYYSLLADPEWSDVSQVASDSVKLQGEVARIYGIPVVVTEFFETPANGKTYALLLDASNFMVPQQKDVVIEKERIASQAKDAYYMRARLNLQQLIADRGVACAQYAAA